MTATPGVTRLFTTKTPRHQVDKSFLVSWCLGGELLDERPIDPVLQPPRPSAASGKRPVAEDRPAVRSVEQGEEQPLRTIRLQCCTSGGGAEILGENRSLAHGVHAGLGQTGMGY